MLEMTENPTIARMIFGYFLCVLSILVGLVACALFGTIIPINLRFSWLGLFLLVLSWCGFSLGFELINKKD